MAHRDFGIQGRVLFLVLNESRGLGQVFECSKLTVSFVFIAPETKFALAKNEK